MAQGTGVFTGRSSRGDLPPLASSGLVRSYGPLVYLAMRLRAGEVPEGEPTAFRNLVLERLDEAKVSARRAGLSEADARDADFAVTALLDESVLVREDEYHDFWVVQTLQLQRYGNELGGQRFFEKLRSESQGQARVELLELYLLCLLAGFEGKYQGNPSSLRRLTEGLQAALKTHRGDVSQTLSPHATVTTSAARHQESELPSPWTLFGVVCVFLVMIFVVTTVFVSVKGNKQVERLDEITTKLSGSSGR